MGNLFNYKSVVSLVLFSLVLLIAGPAQAQLGDTPWPKFNGDLYNSGVSDNYGPDSAAVVWTHNTTDRVYSSPAIASDGSIYFGDQGGTFYALNSDGSEKWTFETGGAIRSSPAVGSNGTIYFGSNDSVFYALNSDGTKHWTYETDGPIRSAPAIDADETIYFGSRDSTFYSLNADGSLNWSYEINGSVDSSPAIDTTSGTIYFGGAGYLNALNKDGTVKWQHDFFTVLYSPAIGPDGTIYIGTTLFDLHAVSPDDSVKWTYTTGNVVGSSPAVGTDSTIYVSSYDNDVHALTPDGEVQWKFTTDGTLDSSPIIDADGTIFVNSPDSLFAVNSDGSLQWKTRVNGGFSSPAIDANGNLYVGSFSDLKAYKGGKAVSVPDKPALPEQVNLRQNFPNPFNPRTKITFSLPRAAEVKLTVYDLLGHRIATLVDGKRQAGQHSLTFDASKLSSGVYIYRLKSVGFSKSRKMLLLK